MRKLELPAFDRHAFAVRYGPWAMIAGASDGTGACYAEALAAMGVNLVLVARRQPVLEALSVDLTARYGISCRSVVQDLAEENAGKTLNEATMDLDIGLYVHNAGADGAGNSFLESPLQRARDLLTLNASTVVDTVHHFGARYKNRDRGGIILMTSGAGLGGQPWLAMYSATKAFEINFAESLWAEWQGGNIDILAVAAPTMNTPSLRRAVEGSGFDVDRMTYDPAEIIHIALAKLGQAPLVTFKDGPEEEKIPLIEAARLHRLRLLAEWAKVYTETSPER